MGAKRMVELHCDGCGIALLDARGMPIVLDELYKFDYKLKLEGWTKIGYDYYCPDCQPRVEPDGALDDLQHQIMTSLPDAIAIIETTSDANDPNHDWYHFVLGLRGLLSECEHAWGVTGVDADASE